MQNREADRPSLFKLINDLARDADECESAVVNTGSSLAKRNFVRALFAWIEAVSYFMRQHVLSELRKEELAEESIPKLLAASERSYRVDEKGDVVEVPLMTKTSYNLLFSLRSFAEVVAFPLTVGKGGRNWQAYTRALKIRDKITHPKSPDDLELTEADLEAVREAKGMIIAHLQIFGSPALISHINERRQAAKAKNSEIELTFTEEDLRRFGIE